MIPLVTIHILTLIHFLCCHLNFSIIRAPVEDAFVSSTANNNFPPPKPQNESYEKKGLESKTDENNAPKLQNLNSQ